MTGVQTFALPIYGNTATLNGKITHKNFKEASFDFSFTDIHNLLGFNTTERQNPIWYGKVFASGSAFVRGRPGFVNLDINVAASPSSSFTFTLSDQQEASEYTFITFTDKRKEKEEAELEKATPEFLKKLNREQAQAANPSIFSMNLQADINPGIAITLVMDPNGGDKIRATGNGNLRLEYASDRDMKMFGSYTVEEGHYNFTLQDIIMRDFTIKQGGSISFHGDPMSANVDLSAAYSLNANLQDLDESFAQDKELNRTVVPVNALLNQAAKIVSADQVAKRLEKGWQTDVGEGGDSMSTGEKQLISFARAVLADPAIFVLDEATSSIDTETEQLIQNAISYLLKDRTSFIIAHRLSTIRQADVILVVKAGKIIEQGTHDELMAMKGYYHDLYTQQFKEEMMEELVI